MIHSRTYLQRRSFLEWFAGSAYSFILPAARSRPGSDQESDAIQVTDYDVLIDLDAIAALDPVPAFLAVPSVGIVVIRAADEDFRAFRDQCSHAGCQLDDRQNARLLCPSHSSEYDLEGVPVAGPASRPLDRFAVDFDEDLRVIRIYRKRLLPNSTLVDRLNGGRWASRLTLPQIAAPALSAG